MNFLDKIIPRRRQNNNDDKRTNLMRFARSKQGLKLTAQIMQQTDSLTKKDVGMWRQAWQMAINYDYPKRAPLYDIYTDCLIDMHLTGCIGQRKGKTLHKKYKIVNNKGEEVADATALIQKEWFLDFIDFALDSRFWGHSLIQLGDIINDTAGMRFDGVQLVPRKHVVPEYGMVVRDPSDDWHTGVPFREGEFADWCVEVGKPRDLGLLLKCAPSCISKKNMLAFWDMFGEIFGAPMRIARTSTTDSAERDRIEKSLDTMGAAFWALFPEGTDIEITESSRGDAFNVYDKRVDRCNSELSKGILMQTMTIDSGSSLSQSETHLEIFNDVVEADAKFIDFVVNDKLIPLMIKHGFPLKGLSFHWDDSATYTPAEQREMERMLLQFYEIDPAYFTEKYNIKITGTRMPPFAQQNNNTTDGDNNNGSKQAKPHADDFFA